MKTTAKFFLLIISAIVIWSCDSETIPNDNNSNEISLKSSEEYRYDFNITGDEEGVTIKIEATHYEISEIIRDQTTNWSVVYHYKPEQGFTGKDSVTIETCTGGTGVNCTEIHQVKLYFNITE